MSYIPEDLKYTETHEWVREEDGYIVIGITDFAQHALGDLVFVNLPEVGDDITMETAFADVESVKAVSDVMSPVSGVVAEINEEIVDNPAIINEDPYEAWFIKVKEVSATASLMDASEYEELCENEEE